MHAMKSPKPNTTKWQGQTTHTRWTHLPRCPIRSLGTVHEQSRQVRRHSGVRGGLGLRWLVCRPKNRQISACTNGPCKAVRAACKHDGAHTLAVRATGAASGISIRQRNGHDTPSNLRQLCDRAHDHERREVHCVRRCKYCGTNSTSDPAKEREAVCAQRLVRRRRLRSSPPLNPEKGFWIETSTKYGSSRSQCYFFACWAKYAKKHYLPCFCNDCGKKRLECGLHCVSCDDRRSAWVQTCWSIATVSATEVCKRTPPRDRHAW